ncbi:MAG: tyrosine-type recombinase/integrase [Chloroflexi bacterium]|nr:tyrosine-type recombinase/integrase [Chloroflexota bacterium]
MKQDIDAFLDYLRTEKSCSQNTIAAYRNDLNQLATHVDGERSKGTITSNDDLLKSYLISLRGKGYSSATAARKVASAKSFFRFLVEVGKLKENPLRNLIPPQVKRHVPKFLSQGEYRRLLGQATRLSSLEAKRDVVMLELLYATGLRVSELVSLNVKDIDLEQSCVHCVHGSSKRRIPFDYRTRELLSIFLENDRLDLLYDEKQDALFLNRRGGRLTRQGFWQITKNYASRAGLDGQITPQTLRHSFAAHKIQSGSDLHSVQQALGHVYASSTRIYKRPASSLR